jgi:hypothetical protein
MSYPYVGDARTEKQKQRDKNNRGVIGHGGRLHHTTDPHKHYQRTLKTIRMYMAQEIVRRYRERKRHATHTVNKSTKSPKDRDARFWEEDF